MQTYDRIRQLCKDHGITVTGLEKTLGFARGSLCKIDKNKPSSEKAQKIADFFDVSVSYLMTGNEPKAYYDKIETAVIAEELFKNEDIRALLSAAHGCPPQVLRSTTELLKQWKETNPDG